MSKKESEFDRYERMKKLEREAEAEKKKNTGEIKKKGGRPKPLTVGSMRNWSKDYEDLVYEEYSEY